MAERPTRPTLPRNRTSEGSLHEEPSRARQTTRDSKRQRSASARTSSPEGPLFACPYSKHDPERYSHKNVAEQDYRNCSSGYWTSIPRLKQHLYRTHDRSQRCCERCWLNFPNDESLRRHVDTLECQRREMPEEKMDEETHLRVKERVLGKPMESWYNIYRVLFPEDDLPSSPLAEWVVGNDLRSCFEMLRKQLPLLLLQAAVQREPAAANVQMNRRTPFPTTADTIQQALLFCQKEWGRQMDLSHIFDTEPPSFAGSSRSTSSRTPQTTSPSQLLHSSRVSEADEYEDATSGMGYPEVIAPGRPLAPQQRYTTRAPNVQPTYSRMPYTPVGYHPATTAPMSEAAYDALNMPEDLYEDYDMHEEDY